MNKVIIPVIVTTEYRGVFFGYIDEADTEKTVLTLNKARNVIYWHDSVRGFVGLSATGPNDKCKIGIEAGGPMTVHKVTSVTKCSQEAETTWLSTK